MARDGGVALYLSCARELADHLVAQLHAHHADIELSPCDDPTDRAAQRFGAAVRLRRPDLFTIRTAFAESHDPLAGVIAALAHASQQGQTIVRIEFAPAAERRVKRWLDYSAGVLARRDPPMLTRIRLSAPWRRLRILLSPLTTL